MNSNRLAWIFAGLSTVLLVLSVVLILQIDRTDPEIQFEDIDLIYSPDMDIGILYEGVTAYDEKDGDLTDKIVIEKIVSSPDSKSVSVTYAVMDSSNNFNKKVRVFQQKEDGDSTAVSGISVTEENHTEEIPVSGEIADTNESEQVAEPEENQEGNNLTGAENQEDSTAERDENNNQRPPVEDNQRPQNNNTNETAPQPEPPVSNETAQVGESPVLELSKNEITVMAGVRPAWVNVIKTLKDDKDGYNVLYKNLILGGVYDDSKAGDYEVTLRTTDSDNNHSETSTIIIHVVE